MGDFKVGDRVTINAAGWRHHECAWSIRAGQFATQSSYLVDAHAETPDSRLGNIRVADDAGRLVGWFDAEHLEPAEPVSASLSACERVLWASTQEYIRAANTEAETKREGYLSAFRQVVEEDRPELAGKQWTVEDGQFVVQQ